MKLLVLWGAGLALLYVLAGAFGVRALHASRVETEQRRRVFIETAAFGRDAKSIDVRRVENAAEVKVGVFVTRVDDFDVRAGAFTAELEVWFRWRDENLRPGETFHLVNGDISSREKIETSSERGEQYERWRVRAKLETSVDPTRYPFGDVALAIQIEDGRDGAERVRYAADARPSGVSFDAVPRSLAVQRTFATVKYVEYASTLGHESNGGRAVRSRFVFVMLASPRSVPTHLKDFQALFASVAIALLALFIKPIHVDPRFGLGVGAVFAAISNNIALAASVPTVPDFTLTAMLNAVGLGTIFFTMVESAISLYLLDSLGLEKRYKQLDGLSFVLFTTGYVALNVVLPIAAGPSR